MSVENFFQVPLFDDTFPPAMEKSQEAAKTGGKTDRADRADRADREAAGGKAGTQRSSRRRSLLPMPSLPANLPEFRVIRSSRRKKSMNAFRNNGLIEIHIPDRMSRRQELEVIPEMISLVLSRELRQRASNELLEELAQRLLTHYLPEFTEQPSSIQWRHMRERWGSCTTMDRTIRIAERLNGCPEYVVAAVLFHELIHLRIPDHGPDFYALMDRYPDRVRAEAYLAGFEAGAQAIPEVIHSEGVKDPMLTQEAGYTESPSRE